MGRGGKWEKIGGEGGSATWKSGKGGHDGLAMGEGGVAVVWGGVVVAK